MRLSSGVLRSLSGCSQGPLRESRAAALLTVCRVAACAVLMTACSPRTAEPIQVTVRDVVTDPYRADGKRVKLVGLLHVGSDGDALYWHKIDINHSVDGHGVSVRLPLSPQERRQLDGKVVTVEGIFDADVDRHAGGFSGAIRDVRHVSATIAANPAAAAH